MVGMPEWVPVHRNHDLSRSAVGMDVFSEPNNSGRINALLMMEHKVESAVLHCDEMRVLPIKSSHEEEYSEAEPRK